MSGLIQVQQETEWWMSGSGSVVEWINSSSTRDRGVDKWIWLGSRVDYSGSTSDRVADEWKFRQPCGECQYKSG